tara:strand:+ start:1816 stop:2757 length:942 start_codon:yes stop_codon:yes gene_type:complete
MNVLLNHFINSYSVAKNLSKNYGRINFFKIFIIRFFFAFNFLRKILNKKSILVSNVDSGDLFKQKNIKSEMVLINLEKKGFSDDLRLNDLELDKIASDISLNNSKLSFKGKKKISEFISSINNYDNIFDIQEKSKNSNLSHVALEIDINKTNNIKKIATSDFFVDIAQKYIGNNNISVSSLCYISNPVKTSDFEKKENAQFFHYDNDFEKFFKVFIYLNDVDEDSGPHSFVQFSHKKKNYKHLYCKRIDDQEIKEIYGHENIITFDRPKGSLIFEDTFGLHKGTVPTNKSRIVLILIYGKNKGIGIYNNSLFV